ncbi:transposase [Escherichia coli]|nr:hypothetical protein SE14002_p1-59 [Escherichia coli]BCS74408.1 hypothetical protein CEC14159_p1-57 [Escherichia coli]GDP72766.1 transposase [Escherichia coli]
MSSRDLAKFTNIRRYATLVCVIQEARATLTDEVIELHERIMDGLFSQAKRKQAERLQLTGKLIQSKLKQYVTVGQALLHARKSGEDPWAAIEDVIPWQEFVNSLEETQFLSRKDNFNPLHLITEKYSTLRKYAPRMLSALHFVATPAAQPLSDALDTIREIYRKQLRNVRKRTARAVLTGMCYSAGSAMRHGSSSLTRLTGQSAMTPSTWRR